MERHLLHYNYSENRSNCIENSKKKQLNTVIKLSTNSVNSTKFQEKQSKKEKRNEKFAKNFLKL